LAGTQPQSTKFIPPKVESYKRRPTDKSEVKSFLQTVQFCKVFMRPRKTGGPKTYHTFFALSHNQKHKFKWIQECEDVSKNWRNFWYQTKNWRNFWHQTKY